MSTHCHNIVAKKSVWKEPEAMYCPLGQGKVDVPAIVDLLETSQQMKIIMVELDSSREPPLTPLEAARASKEYLKTLGYTFGS